MRSLSASVTASLVTVVLCTACWWLWAADHALAWRLGLGEFDLPLRVLAIFGLLSLLDRLLPSAVE
jgi:low temperature requirement protein LtrA